MHQCCTALLLQRAVRKAAGFSMSRRAPAAEHSDLSATRASNDFAQAARSGELAAPHARVAAAASGAHIFLSAPGRPQGPGDQKPGARKRRALNSCARRLALRS